MKIRIRGNSIRFRLSQNEVKELSETGKCEERCHFNNTALVYLLELQDNISELQADFKANTVTLGVPKTLGSDWYTNNKVGFEHTMTLTDGSELFLLLEKDFACLDNAIENQSDNYPNPKGDEC